MQPRRAQTYCATRLSDLGVVVAADFVFVVDVADRAALPDFRAVESGVVVLCRSVVPYPLRQILLGRQEWMVFPTRPLKNLARQP